MESALRAGRSGRHGYTSGQYTRCSTHERSTREQNTSTTSIASTGGKSDESSSTRQSAVGLRATSSRRWTDERADEASRAGGERIVEDRHRDLAPEHVHAVVHQREHIARRVICAQIKGGEHACERAGEMLG